MNLPSWIIALYPAGCFDHEADQRRAFIAFLQTRIIDKLGSRIPVLSEKEKTDIGSYADQYYIMSGFHHGLKTARLGPNQSCERTIFLPQASRPSHNSWQ